ncbi:MAG: hypothetical protein QQN63_05210 [Nitrosopumilus sp.]
MSIKTDGLVEAGPFKVTTSVAAGFVKNNASGELEFGQAASAWDLIAFNTAVGGVLPDFTGLNGDVDDTYQLIFQGLGRSSTANSRGGLRINGAFPALSAPTRFASQSTTSIATGRREGNSWRLWAEGGAFIPGAFYGRAIIHAKSGKVRTGESWMAAGRPVPGAPAGVRVFEQHFVQRWNDTTTNIISLGIRGTFGLVSFAWLYKIKTA